MHGNAETYGATLRDLPYLRRETPSIGPKANDALSNTYRDACGLPLLRMTFDRRDNETKMSEWLVAQ